MFIVPIFLSLPFFAFKGAFDTWLLHLLSVTSPLGFKMLKITCILARAFVAVSVKTLQRCEIYFEHFAKMNTDFFHRCSLRLLLMLFFVCFRILDEKLAGWIPFRIVYL